MQPPGEDFSVFVPEGGKYATASTPIGGQPHEVKTYMARDGSAAYAIAWFKVPTYGEDDQMVFDLYVREFLKGVAEGSQDGNGQARFVCEPGQPKKSISQNGYTGFEFDLSSSCTPSARLRMYTRVVEDQRQVYFGAVIYGDEDENVGRFLKSFTIVSPKTRTRDLSR
jgi:hypothetical protein